MNNTQPLLSIEKYREVLDITPVCTVDVLFFNKNKTETLLFKRVNEPMKGVYFSIGGRLLKNESLEDGAVRQALRETGIQIERENLISGGTQEEFHPTSIFEGVSYHAVGIFYGYVLNSTDITITLDGQHSDYQWFPVSDETIHPLIKSKIKTLLENI